MKYLKPVEIGERVRTARLIMKMTLKELAKKTGINYASVYRIEKGKKIINLEELIKIAEYTKKPISYFIQEGNSVIEYFYPTTYREEK